MDRRLSLAHKEVKFIHNYLVRVPGLPHLLGTMTTLRFFWIFLSWSYSTLFSAHLELIFVSHIQYTYNILFLREIHWIEWIHYTHKNSCFMVACCINQPSQQGMRGWSKPTYPLIFRTAPSLSKAARMFFWRSDDNTSEYLKVPGKH